MNRILPKGESDIRMEKQQQKPVIVVNYDPEWPLIFERLKKVIGDRLGELALSIEHMGSTAVPGLAAKPIIDLTVVIESNAVLPQVIERLGELGYRHKGDQGVPGREAFAREGADVPRDGRTTVWIPQHVYVSPADSPALARHLAFRDYLRADPEAAQAYAELKRGLAVCYRHNREAYTQAKTGFVRDILTKAMTENGDSRETKS